jgi:hypothetical protein
MPELQEEFLTFLATLIVVTHTHTHHICHMHFTSAARIPVNVILYLINTVERHDFFGPNKVNLFMQSKPVFKLQILHN